ncbi:MAG TPA: hypothetical protein VFY89_07465 [Ktedonobacterales bacterium]
MAKTPRAATPAPAPSPAPVARPPSARPPSALTPRGSWSRRALVIFVLICLAGVIPVALAGEILGWWQITRSAPYIGPLHLPWTSLAAPLGAWLAVV